MTSRCCLQSFNFLVSVPAVCGVDIAVTTDLLTVHILGATDDPAYVFASPGRFSHGPKLAKCLFSLPVEKVGLHESSPFKQWG